MGAAAAIAGVAVGLYAHALDGPFVFDDLRNVRDNAAIRWREPSLENLRRAAFESPTPRVVANVSFALNHWAGGYDVRGYRAVNVALHALNGILVFALALATYRRAGFPARGSATGVAALAGLLFVAHPLQVQSVSYVVQRMNVLATCFSLLALLCWLGGRDTAPGSRRWSWWGAAGLCFALAVGSKENAAVLPFAAWLYEWFFHRDLDPRFGRLGLPALVLGLTALGLAGFVAMGGFDAYAAQGFSLRERLLTQLRVFWIYAGLVLLPLPSRLNLLHDVEVSRSLLEPATTALGLLGLAALLATAARLARPQPLVAFGLLWFPLCLLLESSLLPLALLYEHRTYLPLVGVALALPPLVARVSGGPRRAAALGAALVAALGAASCARNEVWRDPLRLWSDVVAKSPGSWRARDELGLALAARGRFDEALAQHRSAAQLAPQRPEPWLHLGVEQLRRGRVEEGLASMRESLRLDPSYARGFHALGVALLGLDRPADALPLLERAAALRPRDPSMRTSLGVALQRSGRPAAAVREFSEALRLDAGSLHARNNLAWLLAVSADAELRDPDRALLLAQEARDAAGPDDAHVLDTLAAALAASGRFEDAARTAEQAAEQASRAGDRRGAEEIRGRAALYRARTAYRESH
jgi:Flp pilus assembly protein TadD